MKHNIVSDALNPLLPAQTPAKKTRDHGVTRTQRTPSPDSFTLRLGQVAARYNIAEATIWAWVKQGKFPAPVKLFGATVWRVSDLEQFERDNGLRD